MKGNRGIGVSVIISVGLIVAAVLVAVPRTANAYIGAPMGGSEPYMLPLDEVATEILGGVDPVPAQAEVHAWGWDGTGSIVAVSDTGVDLGTNFGNIHLDLRGRIHAVIDYAGNGGTDFYGHGTHVAGIVAGSGAYVEENPSGKRYGLGIAPGAEIVTQNTLEDPNYGYDSKAWHQKLFRDATQSDASISSNSWCWASGFDCIPGYDLRSTWVDEFVRDADETTPGDQPVLIVFAAGNDGPGYGNVPISSFSQGKNVISVAASENERSSVGGTEADSRDDIAIFSSRGPASDYRLKPDIAAVGTWVSSALSQAATPGWCGGNINNHYEYCSGTSMATPQVSGGAALFREYYIVQTSTTPSPAIMKAALINSAQDMGGSTDPVPNFLEGWGRMDLVSTFDSSIPRSYVDQTTSFTTSGQTATYYVVVTSSSHPLKVTLVWTDKPGDPARNPNLGFLVNDLDLKMTRVSSGDYWIGNTFFTSRSSSLSTGWTPVNPSASNSWEKWDTDGNIYDDRNNVENVYVQTPALGLYRIEVSARSVLQPSQDFALVVSGASQAAPSTLNVEGGVDRVAFEVVRLNLDSTTADEMRFSNDGATWSDWEPYAPTKYPWFLFPGKGTRTVYAQIRTGGGPPEDVPPAHVYLQYWDDLVDITQYHSGQSGGVISIGHDPRVTINPVTGELCAVWSEEVGIAANPSRIAFSCSDNGVTWSPSYTVIDTGINIKPDIISDGMRLHIVWQQLIGNNWDIYYSRWFSGVPDIPPYPLTVNPANEENPRIEHGDPGVGADFVHVVYQEDAASGVWYIRNINNGLPGSWSPPTWVGAIYRPAVFPAIAVNGMYVHVVFERVLSVGGEVIYRRDEHYGSGPWDAEYPSSPSINGQTRPDIASFDPFVHVVWEEVSPISGIKRVFYVNNDANGYQTEWQLTPTILSPPTQGEATCDSLRPAVDASDSTVAVTWEGNTEPQSEILFARHYANGEIGIPWERWSRITFSGYHTRNSVAPALVLNLGPSPQVNFLWQEENWFGSGISYKHDVTARDDPPYYDPVHDLSIDTVLSSPSAGNPLAWTYQETLTMNSGTWAPAEPGGQVWNKHVLTEALGTGGSFELEAIYRLTVAHAEGHEDGPGTSYLLFLCAQTTSTTDYFEVYYGYTPSGPWGMTGIFIDDTFTCDVLDFAVNELGHHGYIWIRIKDANRQPIDSVQDTLTIMSDDFEGVDGAMWLFATLPAGYIKGDLLLHWTPSLDDPARTPGGQLVRYDIYMANTYHDSYFIRIGSVPTGDPTPEFLLRGGAIAGSPETIVSGPTAMRYPRDAYFTVVGRDANGRTAAATLERVGKFTIDLPTSSVLLSIPLVTQTTSLPGVFDPIEGHWDSVRWYDASDPVSPWKSYVVGRPFNSLTSVDRTKGVWLHLTSDASGFLNSGLFTAVGDIPGSTQISLHYGGSNTWNMVGYPYLTVQYHDPFGPKTVGEALAGVNWVAVETYDPTTPPYYTKALTADDYMLPGLGYWVEVSSAATWTLTNSFPTEGLI